MEENYVYSTYVEVHDEYASLFKARHAYYTLPAEAVEKMCEYIK